MEANVERVEVLAGIKIVLWVSAGAMFIALMACAEPSNPSEPPYSDPGIPTATGPNVATGCACLTAPTKVRGSGQGDWPQGATEQAELWTWWKGMFSNPAWTKLGNFTNGYNCGGYVFGGSGSWIDDIGNYIGTTSGCWRKDAGGTIRILDPEGSYHVCYTSYVGKVGRMCLQDHNDDLYGSMPDIYKKIP